MISKYVLLVVLAIAVDAVGALIFGWAFMQAIAVAHDHWLTDMPTIGYWWAILIAFLLRVTLMSLSGNNKN